MTLRTIQRRSAATLCSDQHFTSWKLRHSHGLQQPTDESSDEESAVGTEEQSGDDETEPDSPCFEAEFPFRQLSDAEIKEAADLSNDYHGENMHALALTMFEATNACYSITVQPRVMPRWSDWAPPSPSRVLQPMVLQARHGPFIAELLAPLGTDALHVDAEELWSLVCYWFALAREDIQEALSLGDSRKRVTVRASLWVLGYEECTAPWARGPIWDFRHYLRAIQHGLPDGPITCVRDGDEKAWLPGLNTEGILLLDSVCKCSDHDIVHMAAVSNFDTHAECDRTCVFAPNLMSYYNNAPQLQEKVDKELEQGLMQGPFATATHWPFRTRQTGSVQQGTNSDGSLKYRRTGDGGGPHYEWDGQPLGLNHHIPLGDPDRFPELRLPSIFTMTMQTAIIASLFAATGLESMQTEVLLSDWEAFYRSIVIRAVWLWTCGMCIHPDGPVVVDLVEYFGSSGAPTTANRIMNVLLYFWHCIVLLLLETVTTWDVTANGGKGGEVPRGHQPILLLSAHENMDSRRRAHDIIHGVELNDDCRGWDRHGGVRKWRQDRYQKAMQLGLSPQEAINQTVPVALAGFFDDSTDSCVRCLFQLVLAALLRMVEMTGIVLSAEKLQRGKAGYKATATILSSPPRRTADIRWDWSRGVVVSLGRELHIDKLKLFDTQKRIDDACSKLSTLESLAAARSSRLVRSSKLMTLIGIAMFLVAVAGHLRALLNAPIACLRVKTNARDGHRRAAYLRKADPLVPFTTRASQALQQLLSYLQMRRQSGYAFFPRVLTAERVRSWPTVYILNDSAGAKMTSGVIDETDSSFRGGGSWLFVAGAAETNWTVCRWTPEILREHCSTVTEMANANATLETVLRGFPGHLVIEVLDNQAATAALRRLGCKSAALENQLTWRSRILESLGPQQLVVTCWSRREDGTLADDLSKLELERFRVGLGARGLPPPAHTPFARTYPRF